MESVTQAVNRSIIQSVRQTDGQSVENKINMNVAYDFYKSCTFISSNKILY